MYACIYRQKEAERDQDRQKMRDLFQGIGLCGDCQVLNLKGRPASWKIQQVDIV